MPRERRILIKERRKSIRIRLGINLINLEKGRKTMRNHATTPKMRPNTGYIQTRKGGGRREGKVKGGKERRRKRKGKKEGKRKEERKEKERRRREKGGKEKRKERKRKERTDRKRRKRTGTKRERQNVTASDQTPRDFPSSSRQSEENGCSQKPRNASVRNSRQRSRPHERREAGTH